MRSYSLGASTCTTYSTVLGEHVNGDPFIERLDSVQFRHNKLPVMILFCHDGPSWWIADEPYASLLATNTFCAHA